MKKTILKKLFIKISKFLGYQIIDQSNFYSPTLDKELSNDLSSINKRSIVLPLGEVPITKKVKSVLLIFRTNTDIEIWDQNKRRLFEKPKIEYSLRSLNSLIKSIKFSKNKYSNINFKMIIVDDKSKKENFEKIEKLVNKSNLDINIISVDHEKYIESFNDMDEIFEEMKKEEKNGRKKSKPRESEQDFDIDFEDKKREYSDGRNNNPSGFKPLPPSRFKPRRKR